MSGRPRLEMALALAPQPVEGRWQARHISTSEPKALGELIYASYKGTVDDEGETPEQAFAEARDTLEGKYGPLLAKYSFVIDDGDRLGSASVVTLLPSKAGPHLVFLMTRRDRWGRGMGTFVLKQTINALAADGHERLTLYVSEQNEGARRLYQRLGFKETGFISTGEEGRTGGQR